MLRTYNAEATEYVKREHKDCMFLGQFFFFICKSKYSQSEGIYVIILILLYFKKIRAPQITHCITCYKT